MFFPIIYAPANIAGGSWASPQMEALIDRASMVSQTLVIVVLVMIAFMLILSVFCIWAWANILQAALKISKWNVVWLGVPIINVIMLIVWGFKAHNVNKNAGKSLGSRKEMATDLGTGSLSNLKETAQSTVLSDLGVSPSEFPVSPKPNVSVPPKEEPREAAPPASLQDLLF